MRYILFFLLSLPLSLMGLEQKAGFAKYIDGKVYNLTNNEEIRTGDTIQSKDTIHTKTGTAKLKLDDGTEISLSKKTQLTINKFILDKAEGKRFVILNLISGNIKVDVNRKFGNNLFEISSGYITLDIKGTSFYMSKQGERVEVLLTEGSLDVQSKLDKFKKLKLTENKVLTVEGENNPVIAGLTMRRLNAKKATFNTLKKQGNTMYTKFRSHKEGAIVRDTNKYIKEMRQVLSTAYVKLKKVRKEKNIMKLDCINSSVMTIKGYLRKAEDNKLMIDEALAKSDVKTSRSLISKIYNSYNEIKQAEITMNSCDSEVVQYGGDKNVTLDVEEIIVKKDYAKESSNLMDISLKTSSENENVELKPVPASPYF